MRYIVLSLVGVLLSVALLAGLVLALYRPATSYYSLPLAVLPIAMAFDPTSGHIIVVGDKIVPAGQRSSSTFWVSILDRDGHTLHTTPTPLLAGAARCCMPTLVVDSRHERIFVGSTGDNRLAMLDAVSGAYLRAITVHGANSLALDGARNRIFALGSSVDVLVASSGRRIRSIPIGYQSTLAYGQGIAVDMHAGRAYVVMGEGAGLLILDSTSGRTLGHTVPIGQSPGWNAYYAQTVVATGHDRIVVSDRATDTITILSGTSGKRLRTLHIDQDPLLLAVDATHSRLLVFGYGGNVHVLRLPDDCVIGTVATGSYTTALALDRHRGRAYLANTLNMGAVWGPNEPGLLRVIDVSNGHVLRHLSTGVTPSAIVMDERAGRVYVGSGGGMRLSKRDSWSWLPAGLRRLLPGLPPVHTSTIYEPPEITVIDTP